VRFEKLVFTKRDIKHLKIMALRRGVWFRLHRSERVLINLIIISLKYVRSRVLINILVRIVDKISPTAAYMYKAYQIGIKIVKLRVKYAKQIGYKYGIKLLNDINYIIYLGIWYLNTSPIYRPNI